MTVCVCVCVYHRCSIKYLTGSIFISSSDTSLPSLSGQVLVWSSVAWISECTFSLLIRQNFCIISQINNCTVFHKIFRFIFLKLYILILTTEPIKFSILWKLHIGQYMIQINQIMYPTTSAYLLNLKKYNLKLICFSTYF